MGHEGVIKPVRLERLPLRLQEQSTASIPPTITDQLGIVATDNLELLPQYQRANLVIWLFANPDFIENSEGVRINHNAIVGTDFEMMQEAYINIALGNVTNRHCAKILENISPRLTQEDRADPERMRRFIEDGDNPNPEHIMKIPIVGSRKDIIACIYDILPEEVTGEHAVDLLKHLSTVMQFQENKPEIKAKIISHLSASLYRTIYEPILEEMSEGIYGEQSYWMNAVIETVKAAHVWAWNQPNGNELLHSSYNLIEHFGLIERKWCVKKAPVSEMDVERQTYYGSNKQD